VSGDRNARDEKAMQRQNGIGRRCRPIPFRYIDQQIAYSFVATVEKVEVRFVPTVPSTVTAATAIRAAIRPYSIAVAPLSFLKRFINPANIRISIDC
jgi:hypothetical protein